MTTTNTPTNPVEAVDTYCSSITHRSLVSSAEIIDHLLDVHALANPEAKLVVEAHLRDFSTRELVAGTEAVNALLDVRAALQPA